MRLPSDWTTERASGWWELHHLIHEPCGFRTDVACDLWSTAGPFGEQYARQVVYNHDCTQETK